jgi:hypothetical protein
MHSGQTDLPNFPQSSSDVKALSDAITGTIAAILAATKQPSAAELLDTVETKHGWFARHVFTDVVRAMRDNATAPFLKPQTCSINTRSESGCPPPSRTSNLWNSTSYRVSGHTYD